jgi:hypothetical protein
MDCTVRIADALPGLVEQQIPQENALRGPNVIVDIDSCFGYLLSGVLVIREPKMFYVGVITCPELQQVNVSACQQLRRLARVSRYPNGGTDNEGPGESIEALREVHDFPGPGGNRGLARARIIGDTVTYCPMVPDINIPESGRHSGLLARPRRVRRFVASQSLAAFPRVALSKKP